MSQSNALIIPGLKVALVPCPALGDTTLLLRLAWRLQAAGACVTVASVSLASVRSYLPGLNIVGGAPDVVALAASNDLVICAIDWQVTVPLSNVAYLAGKKLPRGFNPEQPPVLLAGRVIAGAHNVICRDPKAGKTMVQWIDLYAEEVLGLDTSLPVTGLQDLPAVAEDADRRVAIFPTTPHASKNFSSSGFRRLARCLTARGWLVEFVGIPAEQQKLKAEYPGCTVRTFTDLKGLVDFLSNCAVVISNDSGGGHLGSLLGLRTFTITRRRGDFTWRPGFNELNRVINPILSFKWMGRTVWRPFIPLRRIVRALADVKVQ
ncbi:ADP-heptose--LPS heptosyltransferase [Ectopseudomonas composti]